VDLNAIHNFWINRMRYPRCRNDMNFMTLCLLSARKPIYLHFDAT
jgi:hypothetical protein